MFYLFLFILLKSLQWTGFITQRQKNLNTPNINSLLLSHSDTHGSEFLSHVFTHLKKKTHKTSEWHPFYTENQVNIFNFQLYTQ